MPIITALVFALVLAAAAVRADTSQTADFQNAKQYGRCFVTTLVDMFTDAKSHGFGCVEESISDTTQIIVFSKEGTLIVAASKGIQFHMTGDSVPVVIRVDKGPVIRRSGIWNGQGSTVIRDPSLARQLLHDLARGQRVAIKVGDEGGNIRLDGSRKAIDDFRRRAGLQPSKSLTIPAQPQQTLSPEQRELFFPDR